jgi:UDP-N-acetylglucosamine 3-dehydrogenase
VTRVALIGLGAMGRNHLRVLGEIEGSKLAAVCDQDKAVVDAASAQYSIPGYSSLNEMLEHEKLDAAVVAVPTRFHLEAGLAALRHGLHVFIEKPIATDLNEGRELVAAAKAAGRILSVGHIERFNPAVKELQRRVVAGEIGRIFQVHARRLGPFPARIRDVGVVIDLATHDLDVMYHLAGSEVQRLYAETEQRIHTDHEDILNALLKFESGVLGVLQVNWLTPTKIREVSVLGERGMFACNYLTQDLTYFKNAEVPPPSDSGRHPRAVIEGEVVSIPIAQAEPLKLELQSFLQAVRGEHEVEVDGEAGLRALHLALALVDSASDARVISMDELDSRWTSGSFGVGRGTSGRANGDDQ